MSGQVREAREEKREKEGRGRTGGRKRCEGKIVWGGKEVREGEKTGGCKK